MSYQEARRVLAIDLAPCEDVVNKLVKVPLTQGQFNACGSLVYNAGEGTFHKSSLLRKLNAGDYRGARAAFDLYVYSRGEKMLGLQRRRDAEQIMWDKPDPSLRFMSDADPSVAEVNVDPAMEDNTNISEVDSPKPKSIVKSTEGVTAGAQTIGGATGTGQQTFDAWGTADKAILAKDKAEQLGVEPFHLWERIEGTISILVHSPLFWFCAAVTVTGVFLFLRRRWRLQGEV